VKKIVELHGGSVDVESEVNKGSQFRIRLPYESDFAIDAIVNLPSAPPKVTEVLSNRDVPYKILVAEDNIANLLTIRSYLESRNYQICTASDGKIAVDMAIALKPDIILIDIQMPEMDGLTAIRLIRVNPETANIPIIALTALAMSGDREKCLAAGANEYLAKPIKFRQLNSTLQQILV